MYYELLYHSPLGPMTLLAGEASLVGIWFHGQAHETSKIYSERTDGTYHPLLQEVAACLDAYFSGSNISAGQIPLSPGGTPFQQAVWRLIMDIPYGQTITYGDLAARLAEQTGKQTVSPRAVGQAVGRNPIALLIPCHRVIGAGGKLTGYAGGLDRKIELLKLEGYFK